VCVCEREVGERGRKGEKEKEGERKLVVVI
jgi:hypothetical protein